jgi:hypothetical protein
MRTHTETFRSDELIAIIDARELQGIRWGIMRQMFPKFVEEVELGRYLRTLLTSGHHGVVRIEPHHDADGRPSTHIFDVYRLARS